MALESFSGAMLPCSLVATRAEGAVVNPQLFLRWGSRAAAALPYSWADACAGVGTRVASAWLRRARRVARANLSLALGYDVPERLGHAVTRHYARYYLEVMRLAHTTADRAVGPIRLHGAAHIATSLTAGRGVTALGAHVGNWDVSAVGIARGFGGMHAYAEVLQPAALFDFYTRMRARHAVRIVPIGSGARTPLRVLLDNGVLGMLIDRPFGTRRAWVRFGMGWLEVPCGGIRLALRAGAAIHAVFAVRARDGFDVRVTPALHDDLDGMHEGERVAEVARRFAARLHEVVSQVPEQWCLLHPLARRLPQDAKGVRAVSTSRARAAARGAA